MAQKRDRKDHEQRGDAAGSDTRAERQAAALRANLRRRKAQAQARRARRTDDGNDPA